MKTFQQFDKEHEKTLVETGFWGKYGAGCLILSSNTRRFLLPYRSSQVEQPNTWGTWGGAIDPNENPEKAVIREIREETGYRGTIEKLIPLVVYKKDAFRYHNFIAVVNHEFSPTLNWETQKYVWCKFGDWPTPLHFGLKFVLMDPGSLTKLRQAAGQ